MGIEDILSSSVAIGVKNAIEDTVAGNASSQTIESINAVSMTTLPWTSPINGISFEVFSLVSVLLTLYYIVIPVFKKYGREEINERYLSMENKRNRGPGFIVMFFGDQILIITNIIIISANIAMASQVLINSIYSPNLSIIGFGLVGSFVSSVANFVLAISLFVYAVYLIGGLASVKTLGLMWFLNPQSDLIKRVLRLIWANQLFPLGLTLVNGFIQLVLTVFGFAPYFSFMAPIVSSLASGFLLYAIHTLAWDYDLNTSVNRYKGNLRSIKNRAVMVGAVMTGNPTVIAGAAAAASAGSNNQSVKTNNQESGKRSIELKERPASK